jgi:hypothetical protein
LGEVKGRGQITSVRDFLAKKPPPLSPPKKEILNNTIKLVQKNR